MLAMNRGERCRLGRTQIWSAATIVALLIAEATGADWRATNPGGGGAFNSPVVLPNGIWAVGSDLGGVWVSRNEGADWIALGAALGLEVTHVSSMSAHPSNRILIGTDDGLYTLDPVERTLRQTWSSGYVSAIVVSADPGRVYAAVQPQFDGLEPFIIRSDDAGDSWSSVASNLPADLRVVGMRAHPVDPLGVWVVSGEGRFATGPAEAWFSTDGGAGWIRLDPGEGNVVDLVYAYDETNLNRMYATAERNGQGVFFTSDDTGFSWTEVDPDVPGGGVLPTGVLLADPSAPDHVRTIDFNYRNFTNETLLWESFDGGSTWSRRSNEVIGGWSGADEIWGIGSSFQGSLQTIGYDPLQPATVLWVNSQFVYRSLDLGETWRDTVSRSVGGAWASRGVDNVVPIVIAPSAADPDLLYAGYMDIGLWRSDDGGDSWRDLNTVEYSGNWIGLGGNTLTVLPDPVRADVVWAQMVGDMEDPSQPYHLVRSDDRGATWSELVAGLPPLITRMESLALDHDSAADDRRLFVVANGDIYRSEDDGDTWQRVLPCGDCHQAWHVEGTAFAAGPGGLWRSEVDGDAGSWTAVDLPTEVTSGWTPDLHWLHDSWDYVGPIDLARRGDELWLAVFGPGKGIFHSGDGGDTWSLGLADDYARTVEFDPGTGKILAGSSSAMQAGGYSPLSGGLRVSPTGIGGWQERNDGLAFPMVTSITSTPNGLPWILSPGQGILRWVP